MIQSIRVGKFVKKKHYPVRNIIVIGMKQKLQ